MLTLDWIVLTLYLGAMIALSAWLSRGQRSESDYFVGSRNLPWWAVGISIVATQSSAISFVSIPAFVALREGGGLTWLQYELAVPLAMLFLLRPKVGQYLRISAGAFRAGDRADVGGGVFD